MSPGGPSHLFLIIGIAINVLLTALAIWWLVKQGTRKYGPPPEEKPPDEPPRDQS